MPNPAWLPDWLLHFAPSGLADWLIFAICIYEAYHKARAVASHGAFNDYRRTDERSSLLAVDYEGENVQE